MFRLLFMVFVLLLLLLQVAVADRTALILDIFSQRARTREGKLQVRCCQRGKAITWLLCASCLPITIG
jgi:50S ribosomal subunit-associated GTPase HflX